MNQPQRTVDRDEAFEELVAHHTNAAAKFVDEEERQRRRAQVLSLVQLATFIAGVVLFWIGYNSDPMLASLGAAAIAAFAFAVGIRIRVERAEEQATLRRLVHERHLARLSGTWTSFVHQPELFVRPGHAFSVDVDLAGPASLIQYFDVTHTVPGARVLGRWLSGPASLDELKKRQHAVQELATREDFRRELEAAAGRHGTGRREDARRQPAKLNPQPFLQYLARDSGGLGYAGLQIFALLLPIATVLALFAAIQGWITGWVGGVLVLVQLVVGFRFSGRAADTFSLVAARRGYVESFLGLFAVVENASFESPLLSDLQETLRAQGRGGTRALRRLDRWAGFAELRHQFPVHLAANVFLLWDIHVLLGLERWKREASANMDGQFDALGQIEALASFAGLHALEPHCCMPEITNGGPLEAVQLAHPLLSVQARVANDLLLVGPGTAMILTGSNMAGKSTLLRALGLNVALGLAGGPCMATSFRLPRVHLRASMRVEDSLQRGASYFHAELEKLRTIVRPSDDDAPLLVLLDELLRGTNAEARHVGAKSILGHLISSGSYVLAATHDLALAGLEDKTPEVYKNSHLTDVIVDGEMVFDYRLRPGPVQGSNALRLLEAAGIPVLHPPT